MGWVSDGRWVSELYDNSANLSAAVAKASTELGTIKFHIAKFSPNANLSCSELVIA